MNHRVSVWTVVALISASALPMVTKAQVPAYVVKPVAEKKVKQLPAGPLYWRVENFETLTSAKAAVGPDGWNPATVRYETTTALITEAAGKVWVLTLGPKGRRPTECRDVAGAQDRRALKRPCIRIRDPKRSMSSPASSDSALRAACPRYRPARR